MLGPGIITSNNKYTMHNVHITAACKTKTPSHTQSTVSYLLPRLSEQEYTYANHRILSYLWYPQVLTIVAVHRPQIFTRNPRTCSISFRHGAPIGGIWVCHMIKITMIPQVHMYCRQSVKIKCDTPHGMQRSWTHFVCVCLYLWYHLIQFILSFF